jgi:Ca-activated chloride channel homolog
MQYRKKAPDSSTRWLTVFVAVVAAFAVLMSNAPIRAAEDVPKVSLRPGVRKEDLTESRRSLRVDTNLVLIPVLVTDPYQRPVMGLAKSDFHLFELGAEREISQFFVEEAPLSIGIVFDSSASMKPKMDASRKAIVEFLKLSMPGDEFFLLKFSDRPESVCSFTTDTKYVEDSLSGLQAKGWTSLFDAIYLGVNTMKHASNGRKVLLVLSDGGDNNSRYGESELTRFVEEADVRIFSISIQDRSHSLETLADETGGRAYRVRKTSELAALAATISEELHSEYVLGFTPAKREIDGKYRKVGVELTPQKNGKPLHASWKRGYYSPAP